MGKILCILVQVGGDGHDPLAGHVIVLEPYIVYPVLQMNILVLPYVVPDPVEVALETVGGDPQSTTNNNSNVKILYVLVQVGAEGHVPLDGHVIVLEPDIVYPVLQVNVLVLP